MNLHSKKKGILPNAEKRFRRFEKGSKCLKMLKKSSFRSTKPLKLLTLGTNSELSNTKPFLSFVGKCETFRVLF
jgi:hypothetical protein